MPTKSKSTHRPRKRVIRRRGRSTVDHPVTVARDWLQEHRKASRKESIAALTELGVHKGTAATQYHAFRSKRRRG